MWEKRKHRLNSLITSRWNPRILCNATKGARAGSKKTTGQPEEVCGRYRSSSVRPDRFPPLFESGFVVRIFLLQSWSRPVLSTHSSARQPISMLSSVHRSRTSWLQCCCCSPKSFIFCRIQLWVPAMYDTFQVGVIVPASYDEYTVLVKSGNVASKNVNGWRVRSKRQIWNCQVIWCKSPRFVMRSMSERSTLLQQISTSVHTRLEGVVSTYSGGNWVPWPIELCDVSSGYMTGGFLFFLQHAWTGVVAQASWYFSNSVVINSLSSFSLPFFSHQHVAQCTLHEFAFSRSRWEGWSSWPLIHCMHIPQALSLDRNNVTLWLTIFH